MKLFIAGTGSDVGKSLLVAALCRIFKQDGLNPAPYKAQNMSLNSYATPEGFEIGRAQAMQAEACGIACHTDMNPVLLKPIGNTQSQVVLNGKPIGNRSAKDYYQSANQKPLFDEAFYALEQLAHKYNPVVMEGAGSIAELNLKHRDIVNMPMAVRANAPVVLVADIERGGVFASVYGSIMLLEPEERALVKGIIINKFRGDMSLFDEGKAIIEKLTGVPVLGIVPWFNHITIEEEDSVALYKKRKTAQAGMVNICVVALPHMSNFTDFDYLLRIPRVNLYFSSDINELTKSDIILIPGSKNTIGDLTFLNKNGIASAIVNHYKNGKTVVGICGGFQMMGHMVSDPHGIEGATANALGLGLLPVETVIEHEKTTRQVSFSFRNNSAQCKGYEIHMGRTVPTTVVDAVAVFDDGHSDGAWLNERCWGSYIHGILDNRAVVQSLLAPFNIDLTGVEDHWAFKEQQYDLLAHHLRTNVDVAAIYQVMEAQ
jgi:adenosylcobyric acid synthase